MKKALILCLLLVLVASAVTAQSSGRIFRAPVKLTSTLVNTTATEYAPSITGDGLTLYFCSNRVGSRNNSMDLWMVTRTDFKSQWMNPRPLTSICSGKAESYIDVRDDNLEMLYSSQAPLNNQGLNDLFVAWRSSATIPWSTSNAANLGKVINTPRNEDDPTITSDGLELFWTSSSRPEGGDALGSIYRVTRKSRTSAWSTIVQYVKELDSTAQDHSPSISPDGLTMIFSSTRIGGVQRSDLYIATRPGPGASFSVPTRLPELSTTSWDHNGQWGGDGFSYYFTSNNTSDIWRADRILPMCLVGGGAYVLTPGERAINGGDTLIISCRRDPGDVGIIVGSLGKIPGLPLPGVVGNLELNLGLIFLPPWIGSVNNFGRWSFVQSVPKLKVLHGVKLYFQCAAQDQSTPKNTLLSATKTVSIVVR